LDGLLFYVLPNKKSDELEFGKRGMNTIAELFLPEDEIWGGSPSGDWPRSEGRCLMKVVTKITIKP